MHSRWFKSVSLFTYAIEDDDFTEAVLLEGVKRRQYILKEDWIKPTAGFSSIIGYHNSDLLLHKVDRFFMLSFTMPKKKIDKHKLNRLVAKRLLKDAQEKGVDVENLTKDDVRIARAEELEKLLKKADVSEEFLNAFIDPSLKRIYVSETNPNKVKIFINQLKNIYPTLTVQPFEVDSCESILTQWVYKPTEFLPEKVTLDTAATLKSDEKARASVSNQDLHSEEIVTLINNGKKVQEVSLVYMERLCFKLTHNLMLKSIKLTDTLLQNIDRGGEAAELTLLADYEADWIAMMGEFADVFNWLEGIR